MTGREEAGEKGEWTPTVRRLVGAAKGGSDAAEAPEATPSAVGLVQALIRGDASPTGVAQLLLRDDEDGPDRLWWIAGEIYRRGFMEGGPGEQARSIEAVRDLLDEFVRLRPDLATQKLVELVSLDDWADAIRPFPRELYDKARELTKDVEIDHDAPIEGVTDLEGGG